MSFFCLLVGLLTLPSIRVCVRGSRRGGEVRDRKRLRREDGRGERRRGENGKGEENAGE